MSVSDIIDVLNKGLKLSNQESWDNSGLQIGSLKNDVNGIVFALDLSEDALEYAIKENCNLIITHHPFIFSSIKCIDYDTYTGRIVKKIVDKNITVYSLHTSLDAAVNGITTELADILNIENYDILHELYTDEEHNTVGYGGIADMSKTTAKKLADFVKKSLNCEVIKLFCDDLNKEIHKTAFCGGSGADFIDDAIKKQADIYITADIKYHDAQYALNNGLSIIDAGHFYTENIILDKMLNILSGEHKNLKKYTKNTVIEHII